LLTTCTILEKDVLLWNILQIEEAGYKCRPGFTYFSGVFDDSGDLKSVCEGESTL